MGFEQLLVITHFDELTVFQDHNLISVSDGGQSVSDYYDCDVAVGFSVIINGRLDDLLVSAVQG